MARRSKSSAPNPEPLESTSEAEQQTPDFFTQIQHLNPDDWQSGHKVYVYRTWPVIDKRDEQHYVAKLSEPFDEDVLLRNWGSGKYNLRLNNGKGETVSSKTVSLHNLAFPPKVSPDEVIQTDPRNERYFKVWPVAPQPIPAPADSAVQELSKLATKVLEREGSASAEGKQDALTGTLVKWALEQTSKERDASDPTRIAALLRELKSLLPQQQPGDGLAMVDRVMSIVEKLNPARTRAEAQDPLDYVDKVLTLADKLRPQPTGLAATGPEEGNLASVAAIVHEAADLLKNPLTIAMQVWAASKRPGPPPAGDLPVAPQQPAQPSPLQAVHSRLIGFLMANIKPMQRFFEDFVSGKLVDGEAIDGGDFAYWIYDFHGEEPLKDARTLGAATILASFKALPFWPQVAPYETKLAEFLDQVLKFEPPDEQENETEGPEDAPIDLTRS
jgi:hypothetical protein